SSGASTRRRTNSVESRHRLPNRFWRLRNRRLFHGFREKVGGFPTSATRPCFSAVSSQVPDAQSSALSVPGLLQVCDASQLVVQRDGKLNLRQCPKCGPRFHPGRAREQLTEALCRSVP